MTESIFVQYRAPVKSEQINNRVSELIPIGVYKGGLVKYNSSDGVEVGPIMAEIPDTGGSIKQIKYIKDDATTVPTTGVSNPYIVLRWTFQDDPVTDKPSFVSTATPTATDIIICQVRGGQIKYDVRTCPQSSDYLLKVKPTYAYPTLSIQTNTYVEVFGGYTYTSTITTTPTPIDFQVLNITSASGYVYITSGGTIAFATSIPAGSVCALAQITRSSTSDAITKANIKDLRTFGGNTVTPDNITTELASGKLQVKDGGINKNKLNISSNIFEIGTSTTKTKIRYVETPTDTTDATTKEYVDSKTAFSAWTNTDSTGLALAKNIEYRATSDGFIKVYGSVSAAGFIRVYTHNTTGANPNGVVSLSIGNQNEGAAVSLGGCVPIKSGEYFELTTGGAVTSYYWMSIGTISKPTRIG